ncbi:unnamed protein product, partial [marine sediment metagenome]
YITDRWEGVASIGWAYHDGKSWYRDYISRSKEIIIKRKGKGVYAMAEHQWRPVMGLDEHGVPWVFWNDTTRGYTFFSRWLGQRFDERREIRGAFYRISHYATCEKQSPKGPGSIGMATLAANRIFFCAIKVPHIRASEDRHIRFLDLLEVEKCQGLEMVLNQYKRYPENPIFGPSAEKAAWDNKHVSFPSVIKLGNTFQMIYSGNGDVTRDEAIGNLEEIDFTKEKAILGILAGRG